MKKIFFFAAAVAATMTVNAKLISFEDLVVPSTADSAVLSFNDAFNVTNITVVGTANSKKTAYCAELKQTEATTAWGVTTAKLKSDAQVWFDFKDGNADKSVAKVWEDYVQPNGKAMCAVISEMSVGEQVKITLKEALATQPIIEGADVKELQSDGKVVILTATAVEIRIYSKDVDDNKVTWKLQSVELGATQGFENTNAAAKVEKFYRDGQLIIRKNGVEYNALGAKL